MESTYRRYIYSITAYRIINIAAFSFFGVIALGQSEEEYKLQIKTFLEAEYLELLQKSQDYRNYSDGELDLRAAISAEINSTDLRINTNAIIEYDKTNNSGHEIVISDHLLAFLINYAGKDYGTPIIKLECALRDDDTYHAFFYSQNEVSKEQSLRKAIFKIMDNKLEIRRLSYFNVLPPDCRKKITVVAGRPSLTVVVDGVSALTTVVDGLPKAGRPIPASTVPKIVIKEQYLQSGQIVLYGVVENFEEDGTLIDQENGAPIRVSPIDGFFVLRKYGGSARFFEVSLKYQYGDKFIIDRKIVLMP